MKKKIFLSLFLVLFGLFSALSVQAAENNSMIDQVLKRGTLRVGFSSFVPWAMQDKTGEFIGFEIDIARKLAEDLGVKLELVPTRWSGIVPALLQGKFDIIIGGMSITPERMLSVNFSIPYDYSGIEGVASKKLADGMQGIEAYNKEGIIVAARSGSTPAIVAKKVLPKAELRLFDDEATAVQEILSERVHLFLSSAPLPSLELSRNPEKLFRPFDELLAQEPIAFAVKKGDFDSLNVLDNWITMRNLDGFIAERKDYWFKTTNWEKDVQE